MYGKIIEHYDIFERKCESGTSIHLKENSFLVRFKEAGEYEVIVEGSYCECYFRQLRLAEVAELSALELAS